MLSRTQRLIVRGLMAATALTTLSALSACSGGGGGGVDTPPPPPMATGPDRFGAKFGMIFRAAANSDPTEPAAGDIIPLSLITDPLEVP